jgi:hypothetical protein
MFFLPLYGCHNLQSQNCVLHFIAMLRPSQSLVGFWEQLLDSFANEPLVIGHILRYCSTGS